MPDWYYAQNDEQLGPVSAAALKELAQQGKLSRDDLIWREGMERWAPACKVRGLFADGSDDAAPAQNGEAKHIADDALAPASTDDSAAAAGEDNSSSAKSPSEASPRIPTDDSLSPADEAETAIDVLPLSGPEESKLHVPTLGTPDDSPRVDVDASNDFVVFEPAQSPPARTAPPAPPPAAESDDRRDSATGAGVQRQTRVDVPPAAARGSTAAGVALFLQTFTWVSCLLVILVGGAVYVSALVMTADSSARLAASGVYAAFVIATYFLARSTERICAMLGKWFGAGSDAKAHRARRERNWSRFQ